MRSTKDTIAHSFGHDTLRFRAEAVAARAGTKPRFALEVTSSPPRNDRLSVRRQSTRLLPVFAESAPTTTGWSTTSARIGSPRSASSMSAVPTFASSM